MLNQPILKFASKAARDFALAAPSKGTIAYIQDTNTFVKLYDDGTWVSVEEHGETL